MVNKKTIGLASLVFLIAGWVLVWLPDTTATGQNRLTEAEPDGIEREDDLGTFEPQTHSRRVFVTLSPDGASTPGRLAVQGTLVQLRQGEIIRLELDSRMSEFQIERVDETNGITSLRAVGRANPIAERLRITFGEDQVVGTVSTSAGAYELSGSPDSLAYTRVADILRLKPGEDFKLSPAPKELRVEPKQPVLGAP